MLVEEIQCKSVRKQKLGSEEESTAEDNNRETTGRHLLHSDKKQGKGEH